MVVDFQSHQVVQYHRVFLYELFMLLIKKKKKNGGKNGATHSPSSASQQKAIHFLNMSFQVFL